MWCCLTLRRPKLRDVTAFAAGLMTGEKLSLDLALTLETCQQILTGSLSKSQPSWGPSCPRFSITSASPQDSSSTSFFLEALGGSGYLSLGGFCGCGPARNSPSSGTLGSCLQDQKPLTKSPLGQLAHHTIQFPFRD